MRRSDDRILTTHVGSLVRPPELLQLAAAAKQRPEEQQKYDAALRAATAAVVKRQAEAGVDIVNDGEYGKSSWANYALSRMTGFEHAARLALSGALAGARSRPFQGVHGEGVPARHHRDGGRCLHRPDQVPGTGKHPA